MWGAILENIISSQFAFDRANKTKEFEFFSLGVKLADDEIRPNFYHVKS